MLSAHLDLSPWRGSPPGLERFPGTGKVLLLSDQVGEGWLAPLCLELEQRGRLWAPQVMAVPVAGPRSAANPWSFRPDLQLPLRWGDPERDLRRPSELADAPERVDAVLFDRILGGLGAQASRVLLSQVAQLMLSDTPWLVLDRNGRYLGQVIRSFKQTDAVRGEGKGTQRSAQEYRRLLEVAGLGIAAAWGLAEAPGRSRRLRAMLPASTGWPWLVLEGRKVGADPAAVS